MGQFHYAIDADNIVTITMDMSGAVNTLNNEFIKLMDTCIKRLAKDLTTPVGVRGVVLTSAKKTFVAGADLHFMLDVPKGNEAIVFDFVERIKAQLRWFEKLSVPVVAAINGAAIGGGLEVALAAHYRIALADNVRVGLPEVALGLLPGGGGVVRLVNMLGIAKALPLLLEGRKYRSVDALQHGLVDELVDDSTQLEARAKQWILSQQDQPLATVKSWYLNKREHGKAHVIPGGDHSNPKNQQFVAAVAANAYKKTKGLLPAAQQIIDMAMESLKLPFDRASTLESRKIAHLVTTPQAKNLIHTHFFQLNKINNGESRPNVATQFSISKLGIIGAGMMGQGIAYVAAKAGMQVVLKDVSQEAALRGKAYSEKILDKAMTKGKVNEADKRALLERIIATDDAAELQGCELIIEAVFEKMSLKHELTKALESNLDEEGVWGSNTSSLPIGKLAEVSIRPENFIGIHFFSPVDKMPLVEIICGEHTSDRTLAKAFDFARQIGKTPIVVNDNVGFFTSRTFEAQLNEAAQLVAEGVHPVRVDNCGVAIGMPVGPLTVTDEVSLRLLKQVRDTQISLGLRSSNDDATPLGTALRESLCTAANRGGRQYGGGFYEYSEAGKVIWPELLQQYYREDLAITDQDIKDRLLFSSVITALNCLQEGVVNSVADANIGSLFGIGAPAWTGGYIQFVNGYGLPEFITRCEQLATAFGPRFIAPAIVHEYAKQNKIFVQ